MIKQTDIKLFEMTFGDLSPLTPMQRIDLMEWYFGGNNSKRAVEDDVFSEAEFKRKARLLMEAELESKILLRLSKEPGLTIPVIKNKFRNKYTEDDIYGALEKLKEAGMIKEGHSNNGKAIYSIASGNK